jgi:type II secretion system protein G
LLGTNKKPGAGKIVNAPGDTDDKVWGKKAAWVDYAGPVDGKTVGIAIFDSPNNLRHPTRWHARDYGLFAANPFCEREMDKAQPEGAGDFKLEAGKSVTFSYRIILHEGDAAQAKVAERWAEYAGGRAGGNLVACQTALTSYQIATGTLPTTEQGLKALVTKPESDPKPGNWRQTLESPQLLDVWGREIHYVRPGAHNPKSYDLFSAGPDGIPGNADDIGNWEAPK